MKKKEIRIKGIRVTKDVLETRHSSCDLRACGHACCAEGAVVGEPNLREIKKLLPELYPLMRPEAVKAAKAGGIHLHKVFRRSDLDRSHRHYDLRTVRGACIFLSCDDAGGCVLQKYSRQRKLKHPLKPRWCFLFPVDLIGKDLVVYRWKKLPCLDAGKNRNSPPIYRSCRPELTELLGADGYRELLREIDKHS